VIHASRAHRRCATCQQERERGAVIPIVALLMTTLIAFSALAIDLGQLMIKRRDLQALTDVVSLDLVRDLDGSQKNAFNPGGPKFSVISVHRDQSVLRNGGDPTKVDYELGQVAGKGQPFQSIANTDIPNAVKVTATGTVSYLFAQVIGQSSGTTTRSAIATQVGTLDYESGSFLAATVPNGLFSGLLGQALGAPISLSVLSYQGMAAANVPLGPLATQLGLGSPDQLLTTQIGQKALYLATASVLSSPAQCNATPAQCTAAVSALNLLAAQTSGAAKVDLNGLIGVETGGTLAGANGFMNVFGLVTGSAFLVNGTNTLTVPGVNVNIPGVGTSKITATVTQRKQKIFNATPNDPAGAITQSQIDLKIETDLNLTNLGIVGITALQGPLVTRATIGSAYIIPTGVQCAAPKSATISVQPQPASITGSEHLTALGLLGVPVLSIDVNNLNATLNGTPGSNTFNHTADFGPPDGTAGDVTIGSSTLGLPNYLQGTTGNVTVLGVPPLPLGTLISSLNTRLNPVLTSIDDYLVKQVAQGLGMYVGGAAVGADHLNCKAPQLAG